jgi:hypothetical protein
MQRTSEEVPRPSTENRDVLGKLHDAHAGHVTEIDFMDRESE